ncbi:MAG: tRNA (N6-threonylcarbamoyladenosine(37)-N6)-methyltransferase TrmO [Pseudomonadota bacterium]
MQPSTAKYFYPRLTLLMAAAVMALLTTAMARAENLSYTMNPIGHVAGKDGKTQIVIDAKYQDGLLRLDDFSHVWVIWWFDQHDNPVQRQILQVHPRRDPRNPLSGVFATRAPVRPNLIGLTLCRIISVQDNVVEIDGIDAYEGTPVLDLKPYIPSESVPGAKTPQRY